MVKTRAVALTFALVSLEALLSVPKLNWELATGDSSTKSALFACASVLVILFCVWRLREILVRAILKLARLIAAIRQWQWIILCFVAGALLRVVWVLLFPIRQVSDHAAYFRLAQNLIEGGNYQGNGLGVAYWPPGYPFFLFLNFLAFGVHAWTPLLANLLLYGGTLLAVYRLAVLLADDTVAHFATLMLVVWPTYLTSAGLASKEMMLILLLPVALLLYFSASKSDSAGNSLALVFLTGLVLGFAALTQPSMLLFPALLLAYEIVRGERLMTVFVRLALIVFAIALVVTPWTLRNRRILHAWVVVSTNGGTVFYRANNPWATGGYMPRGEQDLESLDEVQRSKAGFRLGKEWMLAHPKSFLVLVVKKEILFLGDDGTGVYETLKRGLGISDWRYTLLKGVSNLYWGIVWVLVFAALYPSPTSFLVRNPELSLLMLSVLYLFTVHSIFESNGKYHEPLLPVLAILAAIVSGGDSADAKSHRLRADAP